MEKTNRIFGNTPLRPAGMSEKEYQQYGAKGAPIAFDSSVKLEGDSLYNSSNVGLVKRKTYPNEGCKLPPVKVITKTSPRRTSQVPAIELFKMRPPRVESIVNLKPTPARTRRVVK